MIQRTQLDRWALIAWTAATLLAHGGCKERSVPAMPPPTVTVARPIQKDVDLYWEFTGTTQAVAQVEIRARVEGYLQTIDFEDGAFVEAGDRLFAIESGPYEVKVRQAQAQLTATQADLARTEADFGRIQQAAETNAVSRQQVDQARAQRDMARAGVALAEATLAEAKLNLGYTKVDSPITGRVSRRYVDAGNLVGAGERSLLAKVVTVTPLYVYFNISERVLATRLKGMSGVRPGERRTRPDIPCFVGLPDAQEYPFQGVIDYADITVDPGTGTLQVRGRLPNEDRLLYPGMFVRIRVARESSENAVLVHAHAIGTDMAGKYLLVVGQNNIVARRGVQIGAQVEGLCVIEEGVSLSDRYITTGLQRARPGLPVTPQSSRPALPKPPGEKAPAEAAGGRDDV